MRTLHADLTTAQKATTATPYISITFSKGRGGATTYTYTTADAANRIKAIRHSEEPYNTACIIVLDNHDRALPDLFGYYCEISYGYLTSSGNKTSTAPPLWVKHQFHTSKMGSLDNVLYLEGVWNLLAEMSDIGSLLGATSPPYYEVDYTAESFTIYDIMQQVFTAAGFGLYALGAEDDSIVDTLQPDFVVNSVPFDNAASVIYRLLNMTKVFCRVETPEAQSDGSPTTIGTSTDSRALGSIAPDNKVFHAFGRYWCFYNDGSDIVFRTSVDGSTWSGTTSVKTTSSHAFVVWYDESTGQVHIIYWAGGNDTPIYYRTGTLASAGTVTWLAAEQTVFTPASGYGVQHIDSVVIDSDGYPWIAFAAAPGDGYYYPYVTTSDAVPSGGTWSTKSGFPYKMTEFIAGPQHPICIPLTAGKMYACYGTDGAPEGLIGRLWSGSSWGSKETIQAANGDAGGLQGIADGDDIILVWKSGTSVKWNKRTYGTGWGTAANVATSQGVGCNPALTKNDATKELFCFWIYVQAIGDETIYYKKYSAGAWDASATTLLTEADIVASQITASYSAHDGIVVVAYLQGSGSPYDIKVLGITVVQNASFRIKYPSGYSSYDYTYVSDKPATTDHQFREFEWQDQPMIPNHVLVLANQSADGTWDSVITGEYQLAISNNNEYPDIVMYHVAATLTSQGDADNRAAAIALRMWMEKQLGRLVVPHNCGQELYDWIKIRDERGAAAYTDYPPTRWGNEAVVGGLIHVYDPANGVYDLEITINGIVSSEPIDKTVMTEVPEEVEEAVGTAQEILDTIVSVTGGIAPGQPFRPMYPQPILSQAAQAHPWNYMMNMLTGAAHWRNQMIWQAITQLGDEPSFIAQGQRPTLERQRELRELAEQQFRLFERDPELFGRIYGRELQALYSERGLDRPSALEIFLTL